MLERIICKAERVSPDLYRSNLSQRPVYPCLLEETAEPEVLLEDKRVMVTDTHPERQTVE